MQFSQVAVWNKMSYWPNTWPIGLAVWAGRVSAGRHLPPPPQGRDYKHTPQLSVSSLVIGIKPRSPGLQGKCCTNELILNPMFEISNSRLQKPEQYLHFLLGFCVKIFYIKPIKYKGSIRKGEKLGTLLPLQKVYPGIQSHVHIENCDSSDPTAYL